MIAAQSLSNWSWWIDPNPPLTPYLLWGVLGISTAVLLLALLIIWRYQPSSPALRNYRNSWATLLISCAVGSFVILFARWQMLPYLGLRLLHGADAIVFILYSIWLLIRIFRVRQQIQMEQKNNLLQRYLPKTKNKKI